MPWVGWPSRPDLGPDCLAKARRADTKAVGTNRDDSSGQQYTVVSLLETKDPSKIAAKDKVCTVASFKDLISKNREDMGVLVISSHGSKESMTVEAFADDEKARDDRYQAYLDAGYGKDEIARSKNEDGYGISVSDKFIQKYRNLGQALVFLSTCEGGSLVDDFADAKGEKDTNKLARVALGSDDSARVPAFAGFGNFFFKELDGQPRDFPTASARARPRSSP